MSGGQAASAARPPKEPVNPRSTFAVLTGPVSLALHLIVVLVALIAAKETVFPDFLSELSPDADQSLGLLWQVHAGFLAIAFAGLTIASQVYSHSPVAFGVARRSIFAYVHVPQILSAGLVGNLAIGLGATWLASDFASFVLFAVAAITIGLVVSGYVRLHSLYTRPAEVDRLIEQSLRSEVLALDAHRQGRIEAARIANAAALRVGLVDNFSLASFEKFPIRYVEIERIVQAIDGRLLGLAISALQRRAAVPSASFETSDKMPIGLVSGAPQVILRTEPFATLRYGDALFEIGIPNGVTMTDADREDTSRQFHEAVSFFPQTFVDPEAAIIWELTAVQDVAAESLRAGAFGRAERALNLISQATEAGWARPPAPSKGWPDSLRGRDWLVRPFMNIERAAGGQDLVNTVLLDSAMSRCLSAIRHNQPDRFAAEIGSFLRIWELTLDQPLPSSTQERIMISLQNVAEYGVPNDYPIEQYKDVCTWLFVRLVKAAADARRHKLALRTARYFLGLYKFGEDKGTARLTAQRGRIALGAWLLLQRSRDEIIDPELLTLILGGLTGSEVQTARGSLEERPNAVADWHHWESAESLPLEVRVLEIESYADAAAAIALTAGDNMVHAPKTQSEASDIQRILAQLDQVDDLLWAELKLNASHGNLRAQLVAAEEGWRATENQRLAEAELSGTRIAKFIFGFSKAMDTPSRLAKYFKDNGTFDVPPELPPRVLGFKLRAPKHYFVEEVFNNTYAQPESLGSTLAASMLRGEEEGIVQVISESAPAPTAIKVAALVEQLAALDDPSKYLLITSFGGMSDSWWEFISKADSTGVRLVEVGLGEELSESIFLVHHDAIVVQSEPEASDRLEPAGGSGIAIGVYNDQVPNENTGKYQGAAEEPNVIVEVGEKFAVWLLDASLIKVFTFAI